MLEGQEVNIRAEKRKVYSLLTVLPLEEKCIVLLFMNSPFHKPALSFPFTTASYDCDIEFFIDNSKYPLTYQYEVAGYFSIWDSCLDKDQKFSALSVSHKFCCEW